jgi:hypothetical protein
MHPWILRILIILLFLHLPAQVLPQAWLAEEKITSRYTRVFYEDEGTLRLFNKRLKLGSLTSILKKRSPGEISLERQVSEKIDIIIDRVKAILDMYPRNLRIDIKIMPDASLVQSIYKKRYYREVDFIAFYSPQERTIYISAEDARSNILAHEIAHAIIDQYFGVAAPVKIHEILAQYVDENFEE